MTQIHDTAVVSNKASIGENVIISPYAIIEDDVVIGSDCVIGPHAVIYNGARIGNRVKIGQGSSVSNLPQDLSYKGQETHFFIDDDTTIREFVTLHKGTTSGYSKVGKNCFIMAYTHVGHDGKVGDNCILANAVQLGGHVLVEDFVFLGGATVVHQFCRIGQHSMTGGGFRVVQDVPPYILAGHEPLKFSGLNVIGLRRRGFSSDDIMTLKKIYSYIYSTSYNVTQARIKIEEEFGDHPLVKNVLEFIAKSKRGISGK
jgi:UDP-N-acetylglucosamine acyltransferase